MKKIKHITNFFIAILVAAFFFTPNFALAINTKNSIQCGVNGAAGASGCNAAPTTSLGDTVTTVVNIISAAAGLIAVIMIIIAGLTYVTSAGNPEGTKRARNTILYSVIGLVIVALAQIIVHFVIHATTTGTKG